MPLNFRSSRPETNTTHGFGTKTPYTREHRPPDDYSNQAKSEKKETKPARNTKQPKSRKSKSVRFIQKNENKIRDSFVNYISNS